MVINKGEKKKEIGGGKKKGPISKIKKKMCANGDSNAGRLLGREPS